MKITSLKLMEVTVEFEIDGQKYSGTATPVSGLATVRNSEPVPDVPSPLVDAHGNTGNGNGSVKPVTHWVARKAAIKGFSRSNPPLSVENRQIYRLRSSGMGVAEIGRKLKLDPSQVYSRLGTVKAYARRNPGSEFAITW